MTINCKGKMIDLSSPKIMGILNVTPDSFHDGGKYVLVDNAKSRVDKMVSEGVDIIDIGGQSTRPNADIIEVGEELKRVIPIVKFIKKKYPELPISIDTFNSEVAQEAITSGAGIVNDVSGGNLDPKMFEVVSKNSVPYIIMHMRGDPKSMQKDLNYDNIFKELINYFSDKIETLISLGQKDIIIDPGFGFSKSLEQNYYLLNHLREFKLLNCPILAGLSRKSMIYKPLNITPAESLYATSAAHVIALNNGANILRVHDVKEAKECLSIYNLLKENN